MLDHRVVLNLGRGRDFGLGNIFGSDLDGAAALESGVESFHTSTTDLGFSFQSFLSFGVICMRSTTATVFASHLEFGLWRRW